MNYDRTVHARYDDMEIVRYDRAGKWYLEPTLPGPQRQHIGVWTAAASALWGIHNAHGTWYPNLPGGKSFDRLMRA